MCDKERQRTSWILILIPTLLLLLLPSVRAESLSPAEMIAKSAACLECHPEAADNLKGSKHQMTREGDKSARIAVGCVGCHTDFEKHLEEPSKDNISVPSKLSFATQGKVCGECHLGPHQAAMISTDPHARAGLECTTCHQVHGNSARGLVKDDRQEFCKTCHIEVNAQFKSRSAHPLESGNIRCADCHSMADRKDPMLARGLDWSCQECHSEYAGPFAYEHPVTEQHLFQGSGCTACHSPHGSPNDRLLAQPGNGVCLQCHGIPAGHRTAHSGLGAKVACIDCHSEIHGSNDNGKFLDPQITTKFFADCFQSGCHAR
jgi:DmsE family decaheme c-type cytochrome